MRNRVRYHVISTQADEFEVQINENTILFRRELEEISYLSSVTLFCLTCTNPLLKIAVLNPPFKLGIRFRKGREFIISTALPVKQIFVLTQNSEGKINPPTLREWVCAVIRGHNLSVDALPPGLSYLVKGKKLIPTCNHSAP